MALIEISSLTLPEALAALTRYRRLVTEEQQRGDAATAAKRAHRVRQLEDRIRQLGGTIPAAPARRQVPPPAHLPAARAI
ncbi:hypothetical protein [Jiangella sp. DSM 45060]|uniref:hypothetical protein n=1 Tax=Jiangella sp. DSM 45060 TaxID=1798224 RepID=UPI00087DA110|nr:hypothetical protein [Jiangella sp. DSM 45060]SDT36822.1 hypothetical protein SAMN04515669_3744 [Jiangella sp. DSM 45060]